MFSPIFASFKQAHPSIHAVAASGQPDLNVRHALRRASGSLRDCPAWRDIFLTVKRSSDNAATGASHPETGERCMHYVCYTLYSGSRQTLPPGSCHGASTALAR